MFCKHTKNRKNCQVGDFLHSLRFSALLSLICKICANCEKSQGGRFFTILGIFAFFFVTLKTNSKSSCGFYQIYAAEIAKNHQSDDFSRYLRYLLFFFMLMIIKSKASCRPFFVVRCIASDLEYSIFPTDSAVEILTIALIGLFGLC